LTVAPLGTATAAGRFAGGVSHAAPGPPPLKKK
jgi:hypothetical protein